MDEKIKILEEQIQALKDLNAIKDQVIQELKNRPTYTYYPVWHFNPWQQWYYQNGSAAGISTLGTAGGAGAASSTTYGLNTANYRNIG